MIWLPVFLALEAFHVVQFQVSVCDVFVRRQIYSPCPVLQSFDKKHKSVFYESFVFEVSCLFFLSGLKIPAYTKKGRL